MRCVLAVKYLELEKLPFNPKVARRLPADLAFRYHALPVAEVNRRLTIAMAEPDCVEACKAIREVLGTPIYVVRGKVDQIDGLLIEIWPERGARSGEVLVWEPRGDQKMDGAGEEEQATWTYAQHICGMLNACPKRFATAGTQKSTETFCNAVVRGGYELVVVGDFEQPLLYRCVFDLFENKLAEQLPASLLVAREPRWPIRRILLIVRFDKYDKVASDWVIRLASLSGAAVAILTILPPLPVMYQGMKKLQPGLDSLLSTETTAGIWLRDLAARIDERGLSGNFCLRQGDPEWEIHQEVVEGEYDLIVIGAEPRKRLTRWLLGGLVGPLLRWADRPLLIAK